MCKKLAAKQLPLPSREQNCSIQSLRKNRAHLIYATAFLPREGRAVSALTPHLGMRCPGEADLDPWLLLRPV